jgi:hypothetical protein
LQADSEARIARYKRLKSEASEEGNQVLARKWAKEISEESKLLVMIKRVDDINRKGVLNGTYR